MNRCLELPRCRLFALALLILALAVGRAEAAGKAETNAWNELRRRAAADAVAPTLWGVVENNCEDFVKKYPNSEYVADVMGIEARALFNQRKFDGVIEKFSTPLLNWEKAADQFAYWTARAWFERKNYKAAAENFARLSRDYPASALRLEAMYRESEAHAKLEEWKRVTEELREPDGAFQQIAHTNSKDEWVVSGLLLLSEAELALKDSDGAKKTLSGIAAQTLNPELEWERQFLLCRVQLAGGDAKAALVMSTNLLEAATPNSGWKAKSRILKGEIYENLGQVAEAIQTYEVNLNADLPDVRRQALLRIVELTLRQNKIEEATQKLVDYLAKNPAEKGSDFEWLMLGELRLKGYLTTTPGTLALGQGTNLLQQAEESFTKIVKGLTNSEYFGKAELNLGWCYAKEGRISESLDAFSNAAEHLPFSEDQAVARFKLADTYYVQTNYASAISNYTALIDQYGSMPVVKNGLFEQALYQLVRAGLAQDNPATATNAMMRILEWFPGGSLADPSMLLVGQAQGPAEARKVFADFVKHSPQSPLLPEMKLAMARTYEKETNWPEALKQLDDWVNTYTNSPALPRAEFSRAWASYRAENETNAFLLFTNYAIRFQSNNLARSNDLPARAQYWVGDYYWRQGSFQQAQISYEEISTKWPESGLALQAKMMAGLAAVAGQRPQGATKYFASLISDPNCPAELKSRAAFALGDATMTLPLASDPSKYTSALAIYFHIATDSEYTNSPNAARAWGRLGDVYYALAGADASPTTTNNAAREFANQQYKEATNAFTKAMVSKLADAATRNEAEFRLAQTLAAMARLQPAADRDLMLVQALDHFYNVMDGENLRDNEQLDLFWVKEAGLEA
ncbi:MAG: Tetratricopeptide domain protein, partial [Pedosphaera sp.]|nr:Tetratricopeptide domain protein [Pedosphaera sp.]